MNPRDTSEDMSVALSLEEQRIYIKFESFCQKNAWKIHVALHEICGNSALSYSQVARWAYQFNSGRESV